MEDIHRKITPSALAKALNRAFRHVEAAREELRQVGNQFVVNDLHPYQLFDRLTEPAEQIRAAMAMVDKKSLRIPHGARPGDL